jgi:hypothetical protein
MQIIIDIDENELKNCVMIRWNKEQDALINHIPTVCEGDVQMLLGTEECKITLVGMGVI